MCIIVCVNELTCVDSSTGAFFASCSHDRTARLWSPDRLYPIRTFIGHTMDIDVGNIVVLVTTIMQRREQMKCF